MPPAQTEAHLWARDLVFVVIRDANSGRLHGDIQAGK
jgi:hypothetical protein